VSASSSTTVPFVGLRAFDAADAAWFFGRDRETAALTLKLRASRFTAVVGPSGSGKSSVVRAGVVPLLQSDGWRQIIVTPGNAPLARLARALASAEADDRLAEARRFRFDAILRASAFGLAEIAETLRADAPRLLLVVDQFEELFRYGDEASGTMRVAMREEARAFVELLLTATRKTAGRLQVCVTMRSDYFGACSRYSGLAEGVSASQFLIPLPQRVQLDDAIRKPVAQAGAVIEESLVQRLLVDVQEERDQLPLLQHTLRRLWEQASGEPRTMREKDYVEVGKIAGSINKKAESVVTALSRANSYDLATLECVMKALTDLDERNRATRHPRKRSELLALVSEQVPSTPVLAAASLERVLDALRAEDTSFLVVGDGEDPGVDIGHEALIRSWARLSGPGRDFSSGWLREERDDGERWRDYVRRAAEGATLGSRELRALAARPSSRGFGEVWSGRYGNQWADVEKLKQRSAKQERWEWAAKAGFAALSCILVAAVLWTGYTVYRQHVEASQRADIANRTVMSAQKLLDQLSTSADRGDITIKGANAMLKAAGEIVKQVRNFDPAVTKATTALFITLGYTASDIKGTLGDYTEAYEAANESRKLAERLRAVEPDDPQVLFLLYDGHWRMGDAIAFHGSSAAKEALVEYREAEKLATRLMGMAPDAGVHHRNLMYVKQKIGDTYQTQEDRMAALEEYNTALLHVQKALAGDPNNRLWRRDLANTLSRIGQVLSDTGDFNGAMAQYRHALAQRIELANEDRTDSVIQSNLATSHRDIATAYAEHGDLDQAIAEYQLAVSPLEGLLSNDRDNATWQVTLASLYGRMGKVLTQKRDFPAALERYQKAYDLREALAHKDPGNRTRQNSFALSAIPLADLEAEEKNHEQALELYRNAIEILDNARPRYDRNVFDCHLKIAGILLSQNDRDGALNEYKQAWAIARDASAANQDSVPWQRNLATALSKIGDLLAAQAPPAAALDQYRQALEIVTALAAKYPKSNEWPAFAEELKAKSVDLKP
jgi:tetratricopeptide (TPR) repeat protein